MIKISFLPEHIFSLGSFPITNTFLASLMVTFVLIFIAYFATRKIESAPRPYSLQNIIEIVIDFLFNLINGVTHDAKQSKKFFPVVATIFLFVLSANWIGLIPGVGSIGFTEITEEGKIIIPFLRSANTDLNVTLTLAIISVFTIQTFGIASLGFFKYGKKFINFQNPINFFVGILELIGELAKTISFSFRLFGNVFAGEVLLLIIMFLTPYLIPLPFFFLELMVGFIQAFIFSMLTLVFLKIAATSMEH